MRKLRYISLFFLVSLAFSSCKKEEEINRIPEIEFQTISATTVLSFENAVVITIRYMDENGDIGYVDPDEYALRIKDARLSDFDWYHIPPLTPELEELDIEGTFSVTLDPLFILGSSEQESTSFSLQLRDREGNWSNTIETPAVTIVESM